MKANLISFDDDGVTKSREKLDVYFASDAEYPTICVVLPVKKGLFCEVQMSAKQLLGLIMGRIIDKIKW